jgi:hypothetical protein
MQAPPEPMQLPLDECMQTTSRNRAAASALLRLVNHTSQTGVLDRPAPGTHTGQTGVPHRSGRYHLGKTGNCPNSKLAQNHLETF